MDLHRHDMCESPPPRRPFITVTLAALLTLLAFLLPVAAALLTEYYVTSEEPDLLDMMQAQTDFLHGQSLEARGLKRKNDQNKNSPNQRIVIKHVHKCQWSSIIGNSNTQPVLLVIGISVGSAVGILIFSYMGYQTGKAPARGSQQAMSQSQY
ncbi:MAG: hypothetical protein CYPHOPRED_005209 [Cyphobasidiales sp. Tagirdzhanova-0007]|nr:MAG: hypothetical protein CYPHOPRED_005209 [Cyphobasidiales sp. Tagirdzhanova-0007]